MRLWFLGVRGSTASPGPEFVRYGGHTSCVGVVATGGTHPRLVLDAGTGLRNLTARLDGQAFHGTVVLSHLHWDHVQGLPFFPGGDRDDSDVDVYVPAQDGMTGRDLLARSMSPPSFPITPDGLAGRWGFHALEPVPLEVGDLTVTPFDVHHKGGRTYGFRVDEGDRSFAYIPDHRLSSGVSEEARAVVHGVDVLVHNAQFLSTERKIADAYGHSTIDDVVAFASSAEVGQLVLFHHGPGRTDDAIDRLVADLDSSVPVLAAREGGELEVSAGDAGPGQRSSSSFR